MSDTCIFCRIIAGDIPGTFVYRDEQAVAFRDINPRAPVHVLVVPVEHIESLATLEERHQEIGGRLLQAAAEVARIEGVAERGFRIVANTGPESGSEVAHLHFHVLAGRQMRGMG
ncbi:MAG: histidine triad nucleotide-binding protein [Chloroflexota bacterium]